MEVLNNLRLKQKKRIYSILRSIETIFAYEPQSFYLDKHSNYDAILEQARMLTSKNKLISLICKLDKRDYIINLIRWSHLHGITESIINVSFDGKVSYSNEFDIAEVIVDKSREMYGPLTLIYPPQIKMSVNKNKLEFIVPQRMIRGNKVVGEEKETTKREFPLFDKESDSIVAVNHQMTINDKGEHGEITPVLVSNTNGNIETIPNDNKEIAHCEDEHCEDCKH